MPFDPQWLEASFPDLRDLTLIGRGGQKEVLRGQSITAGDTVVLKLCHLGSDRQRILREISAAQQLASSHVPNIVGYGEANSPVGQIIWLIEEYVEGQSLRGVLGDGPLPPADVAVVAMGVLDALVSAEAAHVVHRDIKPENMILRTDGEVFLVDFGIARHLDLASMTPSSAAVGPCTPGYSPPEQFRNLKHDIDGRADLFALGVTLYESATGSNPYLAGTADARAVLDRVQSTPLPPVPPSAGLPDRFVGLIWAMTRLRRNHRPRTADECREWLREALAETA